MSNSYGQRFILTSFGESHGEALGGVLDGCPAGLLIDIKSINKEILRRRSGLTDYTSQRRENDTVEFLSGIYNGITTGTPISFIIRNHDQKSYDYDSLSHIYRPGHADYTYEKKYGIRDPKGGGRSSGRETVVRVVAGAIAKQLLLKLGVKIYGYISSIGTISLSALYSSSEIEINKDDLFPCPNKNLADEMKKEILEAKSNQDSIGGQVTIIVEGVPLGWGEPIFDKLQARLAYGIFSIGGVKGFEYGEGFQSSRMHGSEMNDMMRNETNKFSSNHAGGVLGGISTGSDIYFKVAFKPTPSIGKTQMTLNDNGEAVSINIKGRHDPCIVPRALVVVEAMTALTFYDLYLLSENRHL